MNKPKWWNWNKPGIVFCVLLCVLDNDVHELVAPVQPQRAWPLECCYRLALTSHLDLDQPPLDILLEIGPHISPWSWSAPTWHIATDWPSHLTLILISPYMTYCYRLALTSHLDLDQPPHGILLQIGPHISPWSAPTWHIATDRPPHLTLMPLVSSSSKEPMSKASAALTSPLGGMSGGGYFCRYTWVQSTPLKNGCSFTSWALEHIYPPTHMVIKQPHRNGVYFKATSDKAEVECYTFNHTSVPEEQLHMIFKQCGCGACVQAVPWWPTDPLPRHPSLSSTSLFNSPSSRDFISADMESGNSTFCKQPQTRTPVSHFHTMRRHTPSLRLYTVAQRCLGVCY